MKISKCPCCGGDPHFTRYKRSEGSLTNYLYYVECKGCGISYCKNPSYTKEHAIRLWNENRKNERGENER